MFHTFTKVAADGGTVTLIVGYLKRHDVGRMPVCVFQLTDKHISRQKRVHVSGLDIAILALFGMCRAGDECDECRCCGDFGEGVEHGYLLSVPQASEIPVLGAGQVPGAVRSRMASSAVLSPTTWPMSQETGSKVQRTSLPI
jgi:hypothetical protein